MSNALAAARKVFPDARVWEISDIGDMDRPAIGVGNWLAIRIGSGWIAAQYRENAWYAPLPQHSRSGGSHTSFSRRLKDLHTPVHRSARKALESVLGEE